MAGGVGPAPKDPDARRRRNKSTRPDNKISAAAALQPNLPDVRKWCVKTQTWWAMWGRSSQSQTFTETDWDALMDAALLHQAIWGDDNLQYLPELRLRMAKFGATQDDRRRLGMDLVIVDDAEARAKKAQLPDGVASMDAARDERRTRLAEG